MRRRIRRKRHGCVYRRGFHYKPETVNETNRAMLDLWRKGKCSQDDVIEAASDPKHPFYDMMIHDKNEALEICQHDFARKIIRCFGINTTRFGQYAPRAYLFSKNAQIFVPTEVALRDPFLREEFKIEALRYLKAARMKYGSLTELADIWGPIDEATQGIEVK
jgi:hypothetical protein